jgi:hypothetical protein
MGGVIHIFRAAEAGPAFFGTDDLGAALSAAVKSGLDVDLGEAPDDGECRRIGVVAFSATAVKDDEVYKVQRAPVSKPTVNRAPKEEAGKWVVQSLIFAQDKFTEEQARTWIDSHEEFGNYDVETTDQSYRFRQYDPEHFSSFRTQPFAPGVTAVLGRVKAAEAVVDAAASAKSAEAVAGWERTSRVNARIRERGLRCLRFGKAEETAVENEERFIFGLVLEPTDGADGAPLKPDTQNDIYSADDIRKTAHGWMENYGQVDLGHSWEPLANQQVKILESYLAPVDFDMGKGEDAYHVLKGTWLLALRVNDDTIWQDVKAGKIGAYSVGGLAARTPVEPEAEAGAGG